MLILYACASVLCYSVVLQCGVIQQDILWLQFILLCTASSLTWVRLCTSRYSLSLNRLPQPAWSQIHCFSCVCVLACLFKVHFWTNSLPHIVHLKGFSPVCVLIWRVSDHRDVNSFWHAGNGQCWISPSPSPSPSTSPSPSPSTSPSEDNNLI